MSEEHGGIVTRPGSKAYPTSPLGERESGIPTGRDVPWEPLIDYRRAGVSETTIHGAIAWAHGGEVFHQFGVVRRDRQELRDCSDRNHLIDLE